MCIKPKKRCRCKRSLLICIAVFLLVFGVSAIIFPIIVQENELNIAAVEYTELAEQHQPEPSLAGFEVEMLVPVPSPDDIAEPAKPPSSGGSSYSGINFNALRETNKDCIAWIKIPGTKINYPVVLSNDTDYYLTHTFSGKESKIGTLFSLAKTDYAAPGKNIAVYGHNISGSGQNMFHPLTSYKRESFYLGHQAIQFDTLYRSATFKIFAVINMDKSEWDPSTATFANDGAFLAFIERAKSQSLYDTGIEVNTSDHVLTLITCDRNYLPMDGRLVIMAVME
jgi:Uncharacterized protein conserved in bacteria